MISNKLKLNHLYINVECESSLKHKTDLLTKLEDQRESMSSAIMQLEKKHASDLASFKSLEDTSKALSSQIAACEESRSRCEADLRIEREWKSALQSKELEYKEVISRLQMKVNQHAEDAKKYEKMKSEFEKLRKKYNEDQQTLEELGIQLSMTKLQMSEMKERSKIAEEMGNGRAMASDWTPDESATNCNCCQTNFSITKRKHHCRSCGEVVCKNCSEHLLPLEDSNGVLGKPVRVCDKCWDSRVN
ncbi:CLUMA_CG010056, isoform C [Clunio marinus]|uniref:CLUMA_CG010056, isoform C n=1 Tax=Clunio marinus TaxID=568069 RepID=A0A1J1IDN1_9DIPT|nr:CLUMA_CG010056, isoform C [Clunio marinus]